MKPPMCAICGKKHFDLEKGGIIYFKKRPSDLEWDRRMKEKGMVGHPPYAEWFCDEHFQKANALKHLSIDEAMKKLLE
ncbi:MAG: hypothetical protein ACTSVY_05870 [Candidatus Helarchaeota archaeon]